MTMDSFQRLKSAPDSILQAGTTCAAIFCAAWLAYSFLPLERVFGRWWPDDAERRRERLLRYRRHIRRGAERSISALLGGRGNMAPRRYETLPAARRNREKDAVGNDVSANQRSTDLSATQNEETF